MHRLVTDTRSLAEICARLAGESYITLDTEFIRERTYYPKLCLVQIAGAKESWAVDPLAPGIDLAPLFDLLKNKDVLKVLHAARQDVEIFLHLGGFIPEPLFDTQVAAMVCGLGESISYENLISKLVGARVDKSSRFTDWAHRPLSQQQLDYAISDVTHLRPAFESIEAQLEKAGRNEWVMEELQTLLDPNLYRINPDEAWERIKLRGKSSRYLGVLQAIARWRELEAIALDVPRGRLIKDDIMAELPHHAPETVADLRKIRGFTSSIKESQCQALIGVMREARNLSPKDCPKLPDYEALPEGTDAMVDLLKFLLKAKCSAHKVVPRIIAGNDMLLQLALGQREGVQALTGWRYEMFGKDAIDLLEGRLMVRVQNQKIEFIRA